MMLYAILSVFILIPSGFIIFMGTELVSISQTPGGRKGIYRHDTYLPAYEKVQWVIDRKGGAGVEYRVIMVWQ